MAKNDFMEGFLRGLYQSGVGNPEVQRQNTLDTQTRQANLDAQMKEKGMTRDMNSNLDMQQKVGNFISRMFGGSSQPLQTAYKVDPNFSQFYTDPNGNVSFVKGQGTKVPQGAAPLTTSEGITQMGQQRKAAAGNVPFDQAKNVATLSGSPGAFDSLISTAQSEGRDYLTKDELATGMKGLSASSWKERADFFKSQAKLNREKFEFSKRQATYGGKMGQGQMALNTAIGHLGDAMDAMTNLGNTDINALNQPINKIGQKMNDGSIVAAGINLTALENELASAYKGGGATDQEINQWRSYFNTDLTPRQWLDAATKTSELLNSKIGAFGYQQGLINPDVAGTSPLSPTAKKTLEKIGGIKNKKTEPGKATHRWNPQTGKVEVIQ